VFNRVTLLLCLDTAMLLLVCVLECLSLTGLDVHVWLGFALCPLVLAHVVLQWQWFITQFQRVLTPGAWRVRVNAGLNLLLLALMAAVLFSGGLVSSQGVESLGETFGRVRIWHEVHGWLNVALVVLVGLHLGLNWDWMMAALRRRRSERPALATQSPHPVPLPTRWGEGVRRTGEGSVISNPKSIWTKIARSLGRAVAVLLVASLAAGVSYFAIKAVMLQQMRARERQRVAASASGLPQNQPAPRPREPGRNPLMPRDRRAEPVMAGQVAATLAFTVLVAVIGRYVFRLRL
jgi:cytochrome b561